MVLIDTDDHFSSPPITATMHKNPLEFNNTDLSTSSNKCYITTSTPMQKSNEWGEFEKMSAAITPVDYSETSSNAGLHSSKKTFMTPMSSDLPQNIEAQIKRKVTFCETPMINNHNYQKPKRNTVNDGSFKSHSPSILKNAFLETKVSRDEINSGTVWDSALSDQQTSHKSIDISVNIQAVSIQGPAPVQNSLATVAIQSYLKNTKLEATESLSKDALKSRCMSETDQLLYLSSESNNASSSMKKTSTAEFVCEKVFVSNSILVTSPTRIPDGERTMDTERDKSIINKHFSADHSSLCSGSENTCEFSLEGEVSSKNEQENKGLWSSVTKAWKTMLTGLSITSTEAQNEEVEEKNMKRIRSEDSLLNGPPEKRVKIGDIKCRKTIHSVPTFRYVTYTKKTVLYYDKATQTNF
ncbi:uncharacterized protein LOC116166024 isoform X2 [Photinus pyralis]|nr:uncharacterized protein LOC116166010 isoform X2 [Photinus pyralis]XP_031336706.1 uncharacterized protein LOC116166024 isoform X2 [Photinus pyralis]